MSSAPQPRHGFFEPSGKGVLRGLGKTALIALAFSLVATLVVVVLVRGENPAGLVIDLARIQKEPPEIDPEVLRLARRRVGTIGLFALSAFQLGFIVTGGILLTRALHRAKQKQT